MLIESAHSILAGLDPSDDMAYALWHGKLWSVHLNDQNGLKYDQDKVFGSVDLRRAFNTVWVLERGGYDGCVGLDVKADAHDPRRPTRRKHLANSREMFLRLLDVVRAVDRQGGGISGGARLRRIGALHFEQAYGPIICLAAVRRTAWDVAPRRFCEPPLNMVLLFPLLRDGGAQPLLT